MTKVIVVHFTEFAEKQVSKLPAEMQESLSIWVRTVEYKGLQHMRSFRGYRDEALNGSRSGQRSARLNKAYRVIYIETVDSFGEVKEAKIEAIKIIEVNKHDY